MTKFTRYVVILLLIAALIPYLVICFYALPFADDFCFGWTASAPIPFVQRFLNQYLLWNGRYTADVLVNLHPLVSGKIMYYQLSSLVAIVAMPVVVYHLIITLSIDTTIQDSSLRRAYVRNDKTLKTYATVSALIITLFYLAYQPNITEGIYWYIGIANYHWGNLLVVVQLTLLLKALTATGKTKHILHTLSLLLLVIAVGFNEIGALIVPLFYCSLWAFGCRLQTANCRLWALYSGVAIVASAFVFFSPGNFVRANEFEGRYDLIHSLFYSTLQTVRFMAQWMLNVPFVLLSAVVLANADRMKLKSAVDFRLLLIAMLLVIFAGSFLPYYATGMLGQHRTINYVFFFFILLWVLLLFSVSVRFNLPDKLQPLQKNSTITLLLLTSVLLIAVTGNGVKLLSDIKHDTLRKYETKFYKRQAAVLQHPDRPIEKLETVPAIFTIVDVRSDTTWWVDKCMKKYYIETKMELK
ncbi:MAG TPA: DUF6056 family protein [Chitinophagales bacterium]|nr:DUF6056 family protein [Chitinophagales bacterium]